MTDELISELERQERELVFARFDHAHAWRLGCLASSCTANTLSEFFR